MCGGQEFRADLLVHLIAEDMADGVGESQGDIAKKVEAEFRFIEQEAIEGEREDCVRLVRSMLDIPQEIRERIATAITCNREQ